MARLSELPPAQGLRIPASVAQIAAKAIPQTEQPGHNGQGVPTKLLRRGAARISGDPQDVPLQMSPA